MRITTWNCCRGSFEEKLQAVVERERPTILALQEVAQPRDLELAKKLGYTFQWDGNNPNQGYGLAAGKDIAVSEAIAPTEGARAFILCHGETILHLLVVWAQSDPSYPENVWRNLDFYGDFLKAEPSIVLGDFNSAPAFDGRNNRKHHELVERLREEFGLHSAYHNFHNCQPGEESHATHYWRWNQSHPFHLDYIFLPAPMLPLLVNVSVGDYETWRSLSDHRPVTAEVHLAGEP